MQINKLERNLGELTELVREMRKKDRGHIQKVGVVRFNPFKDVGGDQSFSIALLNEENSGVIITSLYSREGNRVYAKAIERSQSKYQLSDEEKEAISRAVSS